jgi:hypothetical protein
MTITPADYAEVLDALAELVPFVRRPSTNALALLWSSLPAAVIQELTPRHLMYAAEQFVQDPRRPAQLPTHQALLRYLYRLEGDLPNTAWGLRPDLPQRMARPGFQPLPASQADLLAQQALPEVDGPRHAPAGVLAGLDLLPSFPPRGSDEQPQVTCPGAGC